MFEFICFLVGGVVGWLAKGHFKTVATIQFRDRDEGPSHKDTTPIPASRFRAGKRRGEAGS